MSLGGRSSLESAGRGPAARDFRESLEEVGSMADRPVQYCLRLPPELYKDAVDLALVFDLSVNRLLVAAIQKFVASQLKQESTSRAVERIREARRLQALDSA
jgi:hypothetical protein